MENITLGMIEEALLIIVSIVGSVLLIMGKITNALKKTIQDEMKPVNEKIKALEGKIDTLAEKVDEVDKNSTKDFLVARLGEVERGGYLDDITRQRFYEELERYERLGGNSYIHARYEELKKQGKI